LLVANKTDEAGIEQARTKFAAHANQILFISAKAKQHIDLLKEQLYDIVIAGEINTENTIVTNARHHAALQKVAECLQDIQTGMDSHISGDLLALDIRRCLYYLGEITGQVEVDRDILGTIFGKFCIGK
jgi:tRNA modification GTPase